jgi:hypothetical protein
MLRTPLTEYKRSAPDVHRTSSGLTLLRHNELYRIGDLVHSNGPDAIANSLQILSNPAMYGKTLLFDYLLHVLHDEHGTRLAEHANKHLGPEHAWFARRGPWVCSRFPGHCTLGRLVGGSSLVAPPVNDEDVAEISTIFKDFTRSNRSLQPVIVFQPNLCSRVLHFALAVLRRLEQGACPRAMPQTTAFHMRLGDKSSIASTLPSDVIQQAAIHAACTNSTVFLVAVLNYDDRRDVAELADEAHSFSDASVARATQQVSSLLSTLLQCGVRAQLRSTADADADACFLATVEYYVPTVGGFGMLLQDVRTVLHQMHTRQPGRFAMEYLMRHADGHVSPPLARGASQEQGTCNASITISHNASRHASAPSCCWLQRESFKPAQPKQACATRAAACARRKDGKADPSSPSALQQRAAVVRRLNARFATSPTGVLLRVSDWQTLPDRPWEPCDDSGADLGSEGLRRRENRSCNRQVNDRISASLVTSRAYGVFDRVAADCFGFVVAPHAANVLCSYLGDGCTNAKTCKPDSITRPSDACGRDPDFAPAMRGRNGSCIPGCGPQWCEDNGISWAQLSGHGPWRCAWRELSSMLREQIGGSTDVS